MPAEGNLKEEAQMKEDAATNMLTGLYREGKKGVLTRV